MTGHERIEHTAKENGWTSERVPYTRGTVAYSTGNRHLEVIYTPSGRVSCIIGGGLTFAYDNTRKADQVIAYLKRSSNVQ
jgi:urease accessory protein UreE